MSSKVSVIVPGAIYQVYSQGHWTQGVFATDSLKNFFRESLFRALEKFSYRCYGWSLMDDHYHIVVKSNDTPISAFVHNLNTSYAVHYSRSCERRGPVFSQRYSTVIVQEDPYLKPLVRWIHLNPVRKGLCTLENLDHYQWSSNFAIMNNYDDGIVDTKKILEKFNGDDPVEKYKEYIMSEQKDSLDDYLISSLRFANLKRYHFSKAESWVIGDPAFTSLMFRHNLNTRINIARHIKENISLDDIYRSVASLMNLDFNKDLFLNRSKVVESVASEVFTFTASSIFNYTNKELSDYLKVSNNMIYKLINKGQAFCEGNSFLQTVCNKIAALKSASEFSTEMNYLINDM